uniref:Uncharacterized protein n=1 Tax=Arundo donax TaxID=35708 RepID=A0A0A9D6J6_ARUDO
MRWVRTGTQRRGEGGRCCGDGLWLLIYTCGRACKDVGGIILVGGNEKFSLGWTLKLLFTTFGIVVELYIVSFHIYFLHHGILCLICSVTALF